MTLYEQAKARYEALGVDVEAAMNKLQHAPVALHCWQGDDVKGFDGDPSAPLTGGIQTTGNYPGRARSPEELMADLDMVLKLCPGTAKMNLQALPCSIQKRRVSSLGEESVSGSHLGWEKKVGLKSQPRPRSLQKSTHFLKCLGSSLSRSTQGFPSSKMA